jgi:hypothetical protein
MRRQEVVSGLRRAIDGRHSSDALMRAMPVVMMDPAIEHLCALRGIIVGDAVGPFAKRRPDEALSLAVCQSLIAVFFDIARYDLMKHFVGDRTFVPVGDAVAFLVGAGLLDCLLVAISFQRLAQCQRFCFRAGEKQDAFTDNYVALGAPHPFLRLFSGLERPGDGLGQIRPPNTNPVLRRAPR